MADITRNRLKMITNYLIVLHGEVLESPDTLLLNIFISIATKPSTAEPPLPTSISSATRFSPFMSVFATLPIY